MLQTSTLGTDFAQALAKKDFARIAELLHPEVDFRALTPRKFWEASDPDTAIAEVFRVWFEDSDEIEELVALDTDAFADRERVGYRLRVRNPEGLHLVEQQAYLSERDGRIGWLRIVCSGNRPID
jgi:hypothetical protein